ncbi:hypothetical protein [Acidovorax radicis]|uniref:hypothetical protein n=1 Tax=Acidovorax radicis TaxID=758826 RepID=UPI001CFC294F|nr:hypothetical protein [Acidovorax radicis]UCV00278.1 hypothetical protein KI609_05690 [Acidovorax radicis]
MAKAATFVMSRAAEGDMVKFAEDKDCVHPMRFKFSGFKGWAVVYVPLWDRDRMVKGRDLVYMTPEEVARHG